MISPMLTDMEYEARELQWPDLSLPYRSELSKEIEELLRRNVVAIHPRQKDTTLCGLYQLARRLRPGRLESRAHGVPTSSS